MLLFLDSWILGFLKAVLDGEAGVKKILGRGERALETEKSDSEQRGEGGR
jgi:hypothetical protein